MAGDFRCRAVNEFGAEFSEPAALTVIGKSVINSYVIVYFNKVILHVYLFNLITRQCHLLSLSSRRLRGRGGWGIGRKKPKSRGVTYCSRIQAFLICVIFGYTFSTVSQFFVVLVKSISPNILFILDPVKDTCNSAPSEHFVTLPDGCKDETGKNKVNIGKCDNHPCLRSDTPLLELCEEEDRCCQPGTTTDTIIRCGSGEFKMKRVVSCRCDVCNEGSTIVKGIVCYQHFVWQHKI